MPYHNLVSYIDKIHSQLVHDDKLHVQQSCTEQIASKSKKFGLIFAGQGFDFMAELNDLYRNSPTAKQWIETASNQIVHWIQSEHILSKGMFSLGLHPTVWIEEQREIPQSYLQQVSVSHPLIFIAQIGRYLAAQEQGLSLLTGTDRASFITGYSQGMIPAILISEMWGEEFSTQRAIAYLQYTFWPIKRIEVI